MKCHTLKQILKLQNYEHSFLYSIERTNAFYMVAVCG